MNNILRSVLVVLFAVAVAASASARDRPFELQRDTFAFSNDTFFTYGVDELGQLHISAREKPAAFTHGCFLLTRGVMQFDQFARFAPHQPKLSREEYRKRIRDIFCIPVWSAGPAQKIVIPGFADLKTFSAAYEGLLKENLGSWLMTYFRFGNWRLVMWHPRAGQASISRWLDDSIAHQRLRTLYLARFPKMNHAVIVYAQTPLPAGDVRYSVYDPNYPGKPAFLFFRAATRTFEFEKRWYFPGGPVNVMRVYISPCH